MSTDEKASVPPEFDPFARDAAREPQRLLREAMTATLATRDQETGHPFASLVALATAPDGTPLMLLSNLARHTRNLDADPRASLLVADKPFGVDALTAPRLTILGTAQRTPKAAALQRFVSRHPAAADYAGFADFTTYVLTATAGHLVAGFGRISAITASRLTDPAADAGALAAVEADIVRHMNEDHADAVRLYWAATGAAPEETVRLAGIDPWGCDLVGASTGRRIQFPAPLTTAEQAHRQLIELAQIARQRT
ncbi:MAG: HugZ family protein [Hyphomicrobiaceae bacterium]